MTTKARYQTVSTHRDDSSRLSWQCATCNLWIHAPNVVGLIARCRICGARSTVGQRETPFGRVYAAVAVGGGKIPVDENVIFGALRQRHPDPEWVYLPQVRTQTGYSDEVGGFDTVRYLDAFAMNCFGSKGFTRVAYEIKISRSDWLRELEDPRKRAQAYFLCHEFWFAVAPGVYQPGDEGGLKIRQHWRSDPLDGCGVIQVEEDGTLTVLRKARRHEAWPMPAAFIASLLRNYVTAQQAGERHAIGEQAAAAGARAEEAEVLALPLWNPWEIGTTMGDTVDREAHA